MSDVAKPFPSCPILTAGAARAVFGALKQNMSVEMPNVPCQGSGCAFWLSVLDADRKPVGGRCAIASIPLELAQNNFIQRERQALAEQQQARQEQLISPAIDSLMKILPEIDFGEIFGVAKKADAAVLQMVKPAEPAGCGTDNECCDDPTCMEPKHVVDDKEPHTDG